MDLGGARVVHYIPGRLRLKVKDAVRAPAFAARIREALGVVPGVKRVDVSDLTGSVLVEYDPARVMEADAVDELCRQLEGLLPGVDTGRLREWMARAD